MKRLITVLLYSLAFHGPGLAAQPAPLDENQPIEFGCRFHATDNFAESASPARATDTGGYLELLSRGSDLEKRLIQLDGTNALWTKDQTDILIELARVKQATGDTSQARVLYEQALHNMRINDGVYNLEQLPIILELMEWYMAEDDEFTDQLGDRALFLYEKVYPGDEQIMQLIAGYRMLQELRLSAHFSHDRINSIHKKKVAHLQDRIDEKLLRLVNHEDPAIRQGLNSNRAFHTRYDDLGRPVSSPEGGMDQVSGSTGVVLEEVQRLLRPNTTQDVDYVRAKSLLDELQETFEELAPIDQTAILDFYADYFLAQGDIAAVVDSYERMLGIRVLRPDYQLRSLRALGQLYESQERWSESRDTYNCWRLLSTKEDTRVFIGLANTHRKLGEIELAIHHLQKYVNALDANGDIAEENVYLALKEMHYQIDDFDGAADVTREMTNLFKQ